MTRPRREDSYEDWLLYCYSLGLREQIKSVLDKFSLVALAIQEEHRRRQA